MPTVKEIERAQQNLESLLFLLSRANTEISEILTPKYLLWKLKHLKKQHNDNLFIAEARKQLQGFAKHLCFGKLSSEHCLVQFQR